MTRITDNRLAETLISEEVVLPKNQGPLGFSIIGGTDHSCTPFGANAPGIFISHIVPGGIAALSGKLRMGDRILKVNGTDVTSATHQEAVMELLRPCDEIVLTCQHDPLPAGFQEVTIVKGDGERLGMHVKGGLKGQRGNPLDANDEGVFVSKINSSGAVRRDGRLKIGMRILEVNGTSLLGATHQEAVECLRMAANRLNLVVCKGFDKSDLIHGMVQGGSISSRLGSRASETGSDLSHSVSSLDREDFENNTVLHNSHTDQSLSKSEDVFEEPPRSTTSEEIARLANEVALLNTDDMALVNAKEKSTPEKVLDIVRAAESLALGVDLGPPKSPIDPAHHENLQKTTTIVMSKHTLNTLEQQQAQQQPIQASPPSQSPTPPPSAKTPKTVSDKKRFFENVMEDQHKPTPKSEKVFSFLSKDEVEKLKQEEEKKIATFSRELTDNLINNNEEEGDQFDVNDNENEDNYAIYRNNNVISEDDDSSLRLNSSFKTPNSRIPIRTAKAEKRARDQGLIPDVDETTLSPSELRALKAEKRAAWRQARLKSLEQDSIQAQIMIQSLQLPALEESIMHKKRKNETLEETDGQDELVETCQEKIISLELEDPKSLESPTTPTTEEFIQAQLQQRLHLSASEDSDDNQSVVTVRGNSDSERLVFNPIDAADYANANVFTKQNFGVISERSNLQTIVEVVNPMLCGNGVAKEIAIGRSNDCEFPSYDEAARESDEEDGVIEPACVKRFAYDTTEHSEEEEDAVVYRKKEGGFELSINDKMKNVLKELQLDERVRLSLSRSKDGDELDGLEVDEDNFQSYEEKKGANGTVFMVRERLINDFYEHEPTDIQESSSSQSTSNTFHPEDDKFDNCQIFQNPNVEDFLQHEIKFSEQLPVDSVKERRELLKLDLNKDEGEDDDLDDETPTADSNTPTTPNKTLAGANGGNAAAAKKKKRKTKNKKK